MCQKCSLPSWSSASMALARAASEKLQRGNRLALRNYQQRLNQARRLFVTDVENIELAVGAGKIGMALFRGDQHITRRGRGARQRDRCGLPCLALFQERILLGDVGVDLIALRLLKKKTRLIAIGLHCQAGERATG